MSWWRDFWGPTQVDRVLEVLREDRAAQTALVTAVIDTLKVTGELQKQQLALMTAPVEAPIVRVMTPATEAAHERARDAARANGAVREVAPDDFLAALTREFAHDAR